jgi:hypothetical protein
MIKAYINYPNTHITAHYDPSCGNIQAQRKSEQRYIRIHISTISRELQNFQKNKYPLGSSQEVNDMWLEIDFQDYLFEMNVLEFICRLLGNHYKPFVGLKPTTHC